MDINNILNKAIKVLLVTLLCVMLIIGLLFVTPVYVHAINPLAEMPVVNNDVSSMQAGGIPFSYYKNQPSYIGCTQGEYYCGYITSHELVDNTNFTFVIVSYTNSFTDIYNCYYPGYGQYVCGAYSPGASSQYSDYYYVFTGLNTYPSNDVPIYDSLADLFGALPASGEFYSLPQVNSSTEIDYSTVAAQGATIYVDDPINVYSFLGQYETELSPTSQYTFVKTGENAYIPVVFSSVPLTVYRAFINGQTMSSMVCTEYETGKYYAIFNHFATLDLISPIVPFESLADAQEAFSGASSGGGAGSAAGVVTAGAFSYNVPAGNVLYVKVRAGSLASVTVDMLNLSGTASPYWTESQINTMWASGVSSLPNENTTFPLSGMNRIVFTPDASKGLDGYGRSNFGIAQHAPLNGGWFVVYNPAYAGSQWMYGGTAGRTDLLNINPTVTVNCQYAIEYYLYPLSESLTVDGGTSSSNDDYANPWSGQVDPSGTMQRTDDKDTEPEVGGQQSNVVTQNNMTLTDYLRNIETVISDFANNFVKLLTAPISHISRLITAGSTFMSSISQFFTWLPEPVYAVITSALVVAVVIGVIKLLF